MTRLLQWSDLHREFGSKEQPVPFPMPSDECPAGSIDAILIAGDLDAASRHVASLVEIHEAWQVPVISITGNHEPYRSSDKEMRDCIARDLETAQVAGHDVRVLDRDEIVLGDTRILGCTLWTDFEIQGSPDVMMFGAEHLVRDYKRIRRGPDSEDLLRAADTAEWHRRDRAWLLEALARPFEGKTLVMTHHLPAPELLAPEAGKDEYAPVYVSDMRADILGLKIDAWVTGHTHWARRGLIDGVHGPIAFTANMAGYTRHGSRQNTNFDPYRVIDMDEPTRGLEPIDIAEPILAQLRPARDILDEITGQTLPTP